MFQSNFDDSSLSRHHRNRPGVGEVENRARMTPFCTWNIPTMIRVQFLPFSISTTEKCFSRVLMTFSGPDTTRTCLEQGKWTSSLDNSILHPKHTHNVWVQSLSFLVSTVEQYFVRILTTFLGLKRTRVGKHENRMMWFCTRNIHTLFGVQFFSFSVSTGEKSFSQILMTFLGLETTRTGLEEAMLKTGPGWLRFAPETYLQRLGFISYHFPSIRRKIFWSYFEDFLGPRNHQSNKILKPSTMTWFCTRNTLTLFGV